MEATLDVHEDVISLVSRLLAAGDRQGVALVSSLAILGDSDWERGLRLVQELELRGELAIASETLDVLQRLWYTRASDSALAWARFTQARIQAKLLPSRDGERAIETALAMDALPAPARAQLYVLLLEHASARGGGDDVERYLTQVLQEGVSDALVLERGQRIAETHGLDEIVRELCAPVVPVVESEPAATLPAHTFRPKLAASERYPAKFEWYLDDAGIDVPELPVHVLEDVSVVFRERGVFTFDAAGRLVTNCGSHALAPAVRAAAAQLEQTASVPTIAGTSALLQDVFTDHNYCHWLVDWLTRIPACELAGFELDRLVVHELQTAFEHESLEFVGYGPERVVETANQRVLHFERLVVPQNIHRGLQHPAHLGHPLLLEWWRARAATVQRRRASNSCRLYLPRVGKRSVLNETEVVDMLDRHGFLCVDPSTLSFVEQMSLFATASAVVSPHGAALTNLLFAPASCRVLEMFGPTGGTPAFMVLAKALGQDYTAFVSGGELESPTTDFDDVPIEMDLDALERWLATLPRPRKRSAEPALPASR